MSTIAVIATPHTYLASLGAITDAYARIGESFATNAALGDYARMHTGLALVPASGDRIVLCGDRSLMADGRLADLSDVRLVYLPAFQLHDPDEIRAFVERYRPLHDQLRAMAANGAWFGAAGASILHLAAAGLLVDTPCAVQPRLEQAVRRHFPAIPFDAQRPTMIAGKVATWSRDADGPAMVIRLFEMAFSASVARGLHQREPAGDGAAAAADGESDQLVARARLWMREHFTHNFRIADVAADLGVSHQTLIRRFREAGGDPPRAFVQRVRVDAARLMLEETRRSVAEIAQLVGYSDIASFRQLFRDITGFTPGGYRRSRRRAQSGMRSG